MRILISTILNLNSDINGVVISATEHKNALIEYGHKVNLICPYDKVVQYLPFRLMVLSSVMFKQTGLTVFSMTSLFLKWLILVMETMRHREKYEYFHAHDVISALAFLTVVGSSKMVILQNHFNEYPWDEYATAGYIKRGGVFYKFMKKIFSRTISSNRLKLIHVSKHVHDFVKMIIPFSEDRSMIMYPGMEKIEMTGQLIPDGDYIINVGTLSPRKNQIFLIEILSEFEKLGLFLPLIMIGDAVKGEKEKILDRIKEKKLKTKVVIFDSMSSAKTRKYIAGATIYLHSSKNESFGRTLIESMQLDTPVFALEYNAVHEILNKNGILNSEWKANEIAAYLFRYLKDNAALNELKKEQKKILNQKFTKEIMVKKYIETLSTKWHAV